MHEVLPSSPSPHEARRLALALLLFLLLAAAAAPSSNRTHSASPSPSPSPSPSSSPSRPPAPICPPPDPRAFRFPFAPGESLAYKLDLFGADVGTFDIWLERPNGADRQHGVLLVKARAKTSAFLSSAGAIYQAFATALLGKNLAPVRWREETDDAKAHRSHEIAFPPTGPMTQVLATKDGEPDPLGLPMSGQARDMLSAFLFLRASLLDPSPDRDSVCEELYAGRRMWKLTGGARLRETIETPLGKFATVRVDIVSTRLDDPKVVRRASFWVTDDARRLPVVSLGEFRGKYIRAQLVSVTGVPSK